MPCRTHRKRRSNESHLDIHRDDPNRILKRSPTTLTRSTMDAVAANQPKARLSRTERMEIAKFILWPFEGDRRNPATIRPRVGAREVQQAEALMRRQQVSA